MEKIKGFTITLENNIDVDNAEKIMQAIRMIKGVINIEPSILTVDDQINRQSIKFELRNKFYKFINETFS